MSPDQLRQLAALGGDPPVQLDSVSGKFESFVYLRKYGVIVCDPCSHDNIRSLLWSWEHGFSADISPDLTPDDLVRFSLKNRWGTGDAFYDLPGAACKGSCTSFLHYKHGNLESWELDYFREIIT